MDHTFLLPDSSKHEEEEKLKLEEFHKDLQKPVDCPTDSDKKRTVVLEKEWDNGTLLLKKPEVKSSDSAEEDFPKQNK